MNAALRLLLTAVALGLSACSSFNHDWQTATIHPVVRAQDSVEGRWEGRWRSGKYFLSRDQPAGGRLRCLFAKVDLHHYRADFRANWFVFTSSYSVVFETARQGSALRFHGQQDLGPLVGGIYRYEGSVTPERFTAHYDSSYDRGTFDLARPAQ